MYSTMSQPCIYIHTFVFVLAFCTYLFCLVLGLTASRECTAHTFMKTFVSGERCGRTHHSHSTGLNSMLRCHLLCFPHPVLTPPSSMSGLFSSLRPCGSLGIKNGKTPEYAPLMSPASVMAGLAALIKASAWVGAGMSGG